MDSLTQIALGIATAEFVAGKKLGNKTFLYGAILGTIPDLDIIVVKFLSDVDAVAIHRGFSHSLLFFVFLSPVLGMVISKIEKNTITFNRCYFIGVLVFAYACFTRCIYVLGNASALATSISICFENYFCD
jgi:membrane-bound metal-dependent hydrolase YbcI (DUF457 family)